MTEDTSSNEETEEKGKHGKGNKNSKTQGDSADSNSVKIIGDFIDCLIIVLLPSRPAIQRKACEHIQFCCNKFLFFSHYILTS